jgi:hypothetical protein
MDIPVSVAPTFTGGSVGETLYYGIKLTGSSLAHLSKRHTFVGVTHDRMTDVFDTHDIQNGRYDKLC